ncbi:hypothetical protein [Lebetimonas sp. JH292]|uniref:hypothetical protein n=1 Tax=Lebetimonas sp. JH292 TaxID=990068 RepID=UPI0012EB875C
MNLQISNSTVAIGAESGIIDNNIKARAQFIYNDNSNKHNFFSAGVKAEGNLIGMEYQNIKFSVIIDAVHTKNNTAIPVGIGIFTYLPNVSLPIYVKAEGEYAPKILSFDEADRFSRIDAQIGYFPIDNAQIFLGYRDISFNQNYNSSIYGGIGYNF